VDFKQVVEVVRDLGFPIGVAIYLLVRFDRMMSEIIASTSKELEILYQLRDHMVYNGKPTRKAN